MKGVEANRLLENRLVKIFVSHGETVHKRLWYDLEPTLRAMLPEGATTDISVMDAYASAFERFTHLDEVKARADRIFETNSSLARVKFAELLRRSIGVSFNNLATADADRLVVTEAINRTVDRIVTINSEHFEKFKRTIESSILDGAPMASLRAEVLSATGSMYYPAWMVERVVVDQYLTAHAAIQQQRQVSVGITHYFWRTATDARVRKSHKANEGERFAWGSPPIKTGHPGTDIRCRCIADPDISAFKPY